MRRRQSKVLAGLLGVLGLLTVLRADELPKEKPPWRRLLQGKDAHQATELEQQLAPLLRAGKFEDALKPAQALADLRTRSQGASHWQAADARRQVETLRRLLRQGEGPRGEYVSSFALVSRADQLEKTHRHKEAQPLREQVLAVHRKVLGAEHPDTASDCNLLAHNLSAQSKYAEAEKFFRQALTIRRRALGEEHPLTGGSYNNLALNLRTQGKYAEAEALFRQALALCRKVSGEEHSHTATCYANLALSLDDQDKFAEAEVAFGQALAITRKLLGEEHPQTALVTHNLAGNLRAQGKYAEADKLFRRALAIWRKVHGEDNFWTALGYHNLALNLDKQGHHAEAGKLYGKALAIRRKLLGEQNPETAATYTNLALNLRARGHYTEAEEFSRKALSIKRKVYGEGHPNTALGYNNLALSLADRSNDAEAEAIYRKALAIWRKVHGEDHHQMATGYGNLAFSLRRQGRYAEAQEFLRKALSIHRKALGEEHADTALSYNNLAANLASQGRYAEAEELYRKALTIRRKALGEGHPDTAASRNNLALTLDQQGKHDEAHKLHWQALANKLIILGPAHPDTALGYHNLANHLSGQGKYAAAEKWNRLALALFRKVHGEEHPQTALSRSNLAYTLHAQGKYAEAAKYYHQALRAYRKTLGEEHPQTIASLRSLAATLHAQGNYAEAEKTWARGADLFARARLRLASSGLDRAANTGASSPLSDLAAVLARNGKPEAAWQRFEESLARGTWDDLSARLRRPRAEQAKQAELVARLNRLDQLIEKSLAAQESAEEKRRRQELLTQRRQIQEELDAFARRLEKTYGPAAGQVFDLPTIQAALPTDAALVGWLDLFPFATAHDPNGDHWAFLLRAQGPPVVVRLPGSGARDAWTQADTRLPDQLRAALQKAGSDWQPLARQLRRQRLEPLAKHLAAHDRLPAVRHLIVVPPTHLRGVPVEVFTEGYTVSYTLSGTLHAYLHQQTRPATRGLLALGDPVFEIPAVVDKPRPLPPGGVLVTLITPHSVAALAGLRPNDVLLRYGDTDLAGPADLKPLPDSPDTGKRISLVVWRDGKTFKRQVRPGNLGVVLASTPAPTALREQRKLDRRLALVSRDDQWEPLPGSRFEVEALRRLFPGDRHRLLLDAEASEQQLDALARGGALGKYRYLHLATHGVVDDRFSLRSALILSRDKLPEAGKQLDAGLPVYDGRLTAEAVLRRWHLQAELVTLSACQTGLGAFAHGESFVGFAQVLIVAGSRAVCLSLWKVDDAATALLMERFYQNLLGKREGLKAPLPKAQALAEAKTWLRGLSREEALKRAAQLSQGVARGKGRKALPPLPAPPRTAQGAKEDRPYAHPYYWAAFVLLGDPD
jgi:tetratricopeptide (TPR) repeat protein